MPNQQAQTPAEEPIPPGFTLRHTLGGYFKGIQAMAWAPDGRWLATGHEDEAVRVWKAGTWELDKILTGHSGDVNNVAWAPDGAKLASGSDDRTIRIWDPGTGQVRRVLQGHAHRVF